MAAGPIAILKPVQGNAVLTSSPDTDEVKFEGTSGFVIKVLKARFRLSTLLKNVTGDAETAMAREHNEIIDATFSIIGVIGAAKSVGFANLVGTKPFSLLFEFGDATTGGTEGIDMTVWVEKIDIFWDKIDVGVGVSISGFATDVKPLEVKQA